MNLSSYGLYFPIQLPNEQALHTLDIKRCLKFYLQRTNDIRKPDQLLVAYVQGSQGGPVTKATIARWISAAIQFCHIKASLCQER